MTKEQLKRGKELEALINYHTNEALKLEVNALKMEMLISEGLDGEASYVMPVQVNAIVALEEYEDYIVDGEKKVLAFKAVKMGNKYQDVKGVNIRPKAFISYMLTEAQYHFQQVKKCERELSRV